MSLTDFLQTIGIAIALIGLIWSICSSQKQFKLVVKQMKLSFVTDYTKRYQEIILNFPEEINEESFSYKEISPKNYSKTMRYMRAYFDLCSEEYYLHKNNLIDERVWNNWENGMSYAFKKKAFKEAWSKIKQDTIYYEDFNSWIESRIK